MSVLRNHIEGYFVHLNLRAPPSSIFDYIDESKSFDDNIKILSEKFPFFKWRQKRKFTKRWKTLEGTDFERIFKPLRKPRFKTKVGNVRGFDSETKDGYCKVLSICFENGTCETYFPLNTYDALNKLFYWGRNSSNWFHSVRFDFDGIIKQYREEKKIKKLIRVFTNNLGQKVIKKNTIRVFKEANNPDECYDVEFVDKKYFAISNGKNKVFFWNTAQFYGQMKIDDLHVLYFQKSKHDYGVADEDIEMETGQTSLEDLRKRCEVDAMFCQHLAKLLLDKELQVFGKIPTHHYSPASLAQMILIDKVPSDYLKPFVGKDILLVREALEYAMRSFKGGHFENLVKGKCRDVVELDIVSAYPKGMHDLPDMVNGTFVKVERPNRNARFGAYHVALPLDGETGVETPIGKVYPVTEKFFEDYITAEEYWNKVSQGKVVLFIDGYEFIGSDKPVYPFSEVIDFVFEKKASAKDPIERLLWKLVLNSMYGKTCQQNPHLGMLFNPFYASYITARTRMQLEEMSKKYAEEVYEKAADSIRARLRKDVKIPLSDRIGGIEKKTLSDTAIFIKSGIIADEEENLIKTRCLQKDDEKRESKIPREKLFLNDDEIVYYDRNHVFSQKECARGITVNGSDGRQVKLNFSYINRFARDVFPHKDKRKQGVQKRIMFADPKRHWNCDNITRERLLLGKITSKPLNEDDLANFGIFPYEFVRAQEKDKHGTTS